MSGRIAGILTTVLLAAALWYDLGRLFSHRAEHSYHAGNYAAAGNSWQNALKFSGAGKALHFNRGVARYRMGEFSSARNDFSAAANAADSIFRSKSLYNLGNSFVRLAEQAAATDRTAAGRYYHNALESFREALLLNPEDSDIKTNYSAASAARAALMAGQGKQPEAGGHQPSAAQSGSSAEDAASGAKPKGKEPAKSSLNSGKATTERPEDSGSSRKTMGREQAERLLNEKRGQEALPSAIKASRGGSLPAPPDKDW